MTLKEFRELTKDLPEETVLIVGEIKWGDWDIYKVKNIDYDEKGQEYLYRQNLTPTLYISGN